MQQRQAVAGGHRRDVHAGQGAVPEPAARGLGKTDGGVQHRAQQREDRYVAGVLRPVVEWFVSHNHQKVVGLIFLQHPVTVKQLDNWTFCIGYL